MLALSLFLVPTLFAGARPLTPVPPIEATYGAPYGASGAASRDQFLAVWQESGRGDDPHYLAMASRVSASGEVLDPEGITLGTLAGQFPHAGSDGERFLVAWRQAGRPDLELAIIDHTGNFVERHEVAYGGDPKAVFWDGNRYVVVVYDSGTAMLFVDRDGRPIGKPVWIGGYGDVAVTAVDHRYVFVRRSLTVDWTAIPVAEFSGLSDKTTWSQVAATRTGVAAVRVVPGLHSFLVAWRTYDGQAMQAFAIERDSAPRPLTPAVQLAGVDSRGALSIAAVGSRFVVGAPAGATIQPETEAIELHAGVVADELLASNGSVLALRTAQHPLTRFDHRTVTGTMLLPRTLAPAADAFPIATATPAQELLALTIAGGRSVALWMQHGAKDHLLLTDLDSGATAEVPTNGAISMQEPADATAVSDGKDLLVHWRELRPGFTNQYPEPRVAFVSADLQVRTSFDTRRDDCTAEAVVVDDGKLALVCHDDDRVVLQRYDGSGFRLGTELIFEDVPDNLSIERVTRNGSMWLASVRWISIGIPEPAIATFAVAALRTAPGSEKTYTDLRAGAPDYYSRLFAEAASNARGAVAANAWSAAFFRVGVPQPFRTFVWNSPPSRGHISAVPDGYLITSGASVVRFDNDGAVQRSWVLPGDVVTSIANLQWVVWQTRDTLASRGRIFLDEYAPRYRRGVAH